MRVAVGFEVLFGLGLIRAAAMFAPEGTGGRVSGAVGDFI